MLIAALSLMLMGSSCKTTEEADTELGVLSAGIKVPPAPLECSPRARPVAHAPWKIGDNGIVVLKRERAQLDTANAINRLCAEDRAALEWMLSRPATKPQVPD
jgi:hypothetical protein